MKFIYSNRRLLAFVYDVTAAFVAFWLAVYLRVGDDLASIPGEQLIASSLLFTVTCAAVFSFLGLYRSIWAFASLRDLKEIVRAVTVADALFIALAFLTFRLESVPRSVPFIVWFVLLAALGGARMAFRMLRERRLTAIWERAGGGRVNVLLIGAGDEADLFMRAISANPQAPYNVVGIVGENDKRVGRSIHGVDVLGTVEQLPSIVGKLRDQMKGPSRMILTRGVTRFNGEHVADLLDLASTLGLGLSRLPSLTELRSDLTPSAALRDQPLALEDLLGRPEIKLNRSEIRALVRGRRVLVTGAGGTIGSEIARQVAALEPSRLTLVEFCEYNLYRIDMEMRENFPYQPLSSYIADVRDGVRIDQIFKDERPELVFHAAAIKHVPLAEDNVREAILTNVIGTRVVADSCLRRHVGAMVLISTDKAVHPSSVMGATKRLAEMYCQSLDLASEETRFITVRFGNVLGSTGSVVPRFQEQIARGGPVTVTHPEMTRYFMTVREAVELVLQASAFGSRPGDQRGKLLVLDMGEPVRIADLARQMIRLAGLRPGEDIEIAYTGLRPGEKLHEELFAPSEEMLPSDADGVQLAKTVTVELELLQDDLDAFAQWLFDGLKDEDCVARLSELLPDFRRQPPPEQAAS